MAAPLSVERGAVIGGDFRIVEPLRAGGMGAVYVAEQISTGKRRAVKVMHAGLLDDPKLRERFEREAKVGALVSSDHVVDVVGAGVDASGTPWIAMELLDGEDLAQYVKENGRIPRDRVRVILKELGHALGAAHAAGVVHRDLKPENVFLAKSRSADEKRSVKVLDFGIAKLVASSRTTATVPMGTPAWMAPEQTDPRAAISPATDVWAVGLLAFWLLTGRAYWLCALDPGASIHSLLREILFEPMEPASLRARDKDADGLLPKGFDAWFARSLAREPKKRFADAKQQLDALEPLFDVTEVEVPPAGSARPRRADVEDAGAMSTRSFVEAGLGATVPDPSTPSRLDEAEARVAQAEARAAKAEAEAALARTTAKPADEPTLRAAEPASGDAHRRNRFIVAGVGVAVAAALLVGARALLVAKPLPPPPPDVSAVTTSAPAPPTAPTASAEPPPVAPSAPEPSVTHAPRPHPSAAPAARPFDLRGAQMALGQSASTARFLCKGRDGPRAMSATVVFAPSGGVQRVDMDPSLRVTGSGLCFSTSLMSAHVPPFDGPAQSVPVAVALDPE